MVSRVNFIAEKKIQNSLFHIYLILIYKKYLLKSSQIITIHLTL